MVKFRLPKLRRSATKAEASSSVEPEATSVVTATTDATTPQRTSAIDLYAESAAERTVTGGDDSATPATPGTDLPAQPFAPATDTGLPSVHRSKGFGATLKGFGGTLGGFFTRAGRGIAAFFKKIGKGTATFAPRAWRGIVAFPPKAWRGISSFFRRIGRGLAASAAAIRRIPGLMPRPVAIGLVAFGAALAAVTLVFTADRLAKGGEVLGSVVINGVDLGGLGEEDAIARLDEMETALASTPVPVTAAGHTFYLDPQSIAFDMDSQTMVDAAMRNGRSGTVFGQFGWWANRLRGGGNATVVPLYSYDTEALAAIIDEWETEGIARPAYPGDVRVVDGAIVYEYPAEGLGIERETALAALHVALLDRTRAAVPLTTRLIVPAVTNADVDEAVRNASELIAGDVTLTSVEPEAQLVLPRHLLGQALRITRDDTAAIPEYRFDFDEATLQDYVAALGPYLETDAVDARIDIDVLTDEITIVPSVPRNEPDRTLLMDEVWAALRTPDRSGDLAYAVGREADFSTADAESLGIRGLIGEFTTYHTCCAPRVVNIHQIADDVDGALVMPGGIFSLNDHVGQRTVAKGYVCAPALLGNETVETGDICIGGGTSQFTTTLYNAAFFAGLEDIAHTPHSVYFSRYPEGREATLGWRQPELIFRNDTENAIIIKTHYTATEITVKIYGDNGGRIVTAGLGGRFNHTAIVELPPRIDSGLGAPYCGPAGGTPANYKVDQEGSPGWTVGVYRYITWPDGTQTTETWWVRYQGAWRILEYNPGLVGTC